MSPPSGRLAADDSRIAHAESDIEPVEAVDRGNHEGQDRQLLLGEFGPRSLVDIVGDTRRGKSRQRLRPAECRTFPRAVEGRVAPGIEEIDTPLGLANLAGGRR